MNISELFSIFPPQLATLFIAMLPISELNAAIPIALTIYKLDVVSAYVFSVIGNTIPVFFILWLLGPVSGYLIDNVPIARRFFAWLFGRTRHIFSGKYQKWGEIALIFFVATPLPFAGAWSGAVAAFIFGIPKKSALFFIALGNMLAGVVIIAASLGIISLF